MTTIQLINENRQLKEVVYVSYTSHSGNIQCNVLHSKYNNTLRGKQIYVQLEETK
jgi:hypothetical protein